MPFQYSCFISYRHANYKAPYIEWIVEALKEELDQWVDQGVYQDTDLRGGMLFNPELASALCHSVCMISLYSPKYFRRDHTYCAREYMAMVELEQHRRKFLTDPKEQSKGLVIFVAVRGFNLIPSEIRKERECYNFEPYTMKGNMRRNPKFKEQVRNIGEYIFERCKAFDSVASQHDLCEGCHGFNLPSEDKIQSLLDSLMPWKAQSLWEAD